MVYVIGRMIHHDSNVVIGIKDAILMHIDLALDLYIDLDADAKMGKTLADCKKVQKATTRTHVLRVDNVSFETLFKFVISFFRSKNLTQEWLDHEFEEEF